MRAVPHPPELQALIAAWHELKDVCDALAAENRARFEALESVADAHLMTDHDGRICEANSAAGRLLGIAPHRLRGKRLSSFIPLKRGEGEWHLSVRSRDGARRRIAARVRASEAHLVWRLRETD